MTEETIDRTAVYTMDKSWSPKIESSRLPQDFAFISPTSIIGENFNCGRFVIIEENVEIGNNVTIGNFVRIMPGTRIGDNVILQDYVKLMPGTVIGNNTRLDDYVNTSGYCNIGNNVRIKRCSMIGQAVRVGDNVWMGAGIFTTKIKYPRPVGKETREEEWITIKDGAIIGQRALLLAGVTIGEGAFVGAGAIITKDCEPEGVYVGCPAKLTRYHR